MKASVIVGLVLFGACGGTSGASAPKAAVPSPAVGVGELFGFSAAAVASWDGIANGAVALQVDDATHARLAVAQQAGGWTKVAVATLTFAHDGCNQEPETTLDPGRYRLDATTTAIGVRFVCGSEFPAGEAVETWLHLYRLDGGELEEVFVGLVKVDSHQRGPGEDFVATSTVELEPGGGPFADLVVRTTTVTTPFDEGEATTTTTQIERHVWDGSVFRLQDR